MLVGRFTDSAPARASPCRRRPGPQLAPANEVSRRNSRPGPRLSPPCSGQISGVRVVQWCAARVGWVHDRSPDVGLRFGKVAPAMSTEVNPLPDGGRRILRCPTCGRSDEVTQTDLLRRSRDGWPKCCGQVMDYIAPDVGRCPTCGRAGGLTFPGVSPTGTDVKIVCMLCALSSHGGTKP